MIICFLWSDASIWFVFRVGSHVTYSCGRKAPWGIVFLGTYNNILGQRVTYPCVDNPVSGTPYMKIWYWLYWDIPPVAHFYVTVRNLVWYLWLVSSTFGPYVNKLVDWAKGENSNRVNAMKIYCQLVDMRMCVPSLTPKVCLLVLYRNL